MSEIKILPKDHKKARELLAIKRINKRRRDIEKHHERKQLEKENGEFNYD